MTLIIDPNNTNLYTQPLAAPPTYPVPPGSGITLPVGANANNRAADVQVIQHLLNGVAQADGGPVQLLNEDGLCGPKTIQAISRFAAARGWPADKIYPNSMLHNMLCFYSDNAALFPNPYGNP